MRERAAEKLLPPPRSPPPLTSGFDAEIYSLIHEDEGQSTLLLRSRTLSLMPYRGHASPLHRPHHRYLAACCICTA